MANRRMFSLDVVDTDSFLDMPASTQSLYFHLGMRADDDGFVSSPKKIASIAGCAADDLKLLIVKGYIIPFDSGVVVITDWKTNNYIQKDRYRKTRYSEEAALLVQDDGKYKMNTGCIQNVSALDTQVRLGKYSIDQDSIDQSNIDIICPELKALPSDSSGILLPLVDKTDYDVSLSKIEKWKAAYPAVDIEQELRRMSAWLDANPKRKKTRRGVDRFITSWLGREQDKGGIYKNSSRQQAVPEKTFYEVSEPEYYKDMQPLGESEENVWGD